MRLWISNILLSLVYRLGFEVVLPKRVSSIYNKSGLEVTGDCVLVLLHKVEEKTAGGIVLVQSTVDKNQLAQQIGLLVDAGDEAMRSKELRRIQIGDPVFFPRYAGSHFPIGGEDYWVMTNRHICGKATKLPDFMVWGAAATHEVMPPNSGTLEAQAA